MTEEQPLRSQTDRITALEVSLAHMRERIAELHTHNKVQDMEAEKRADRLGREVEKLTARQWSFITWLSVALFTTLSSIALKALGLL
jgi:uncharacterized coiled-coil protein SlyX